MTTTKEKQENKETRKAKEKLDLLTVFFVVRHLGGFGVLVTVGTVDMDDFVCEVRVLCGGADPRTLADGFVDVNGLLDGGTTNGSVDGGGLGHADVVVETRL